METQALVLQDANTIYAVDDNGEAILEPLGKDDLVPDTTVCIDNPWREEGYATCKVLGGDGGEPLLEFGSCYGKIEFDEEKGHWVCLALMRKEAVLQGILEEKMASVDSELEELDKNLERILLGKKKKSFTQKLLKRAGKGKKGRKKKGQKSASPGA
jgi:hypothetical protein